MTATTDPTTNDTGLAGDRTSTRDRVLEAAMDLFAEDGFSGTMISAVDPANEGDQVPELREAAMVGHDMRTA